MAEYARIVNDIISVYERSLEKQLPGTDARRKRKDEIVALQSLFSEVKRLRSITKPVPNTVNLLPSVSRENNMTGRIILGRIKD